MRPKLVSRKYFPCPLIFYTFGYSYHIVYIYFSFSSFFFFKADQSLMKYDFDTSGYDESDLNKRSDAETFRHY